MEHESDVHTNCNWYARDSHQRIGTSTGGLLNQRMSGNFRIIKIGQNTEKSPGYLGRLAVPQTSVETIS